MSAGTAAYCYVDTAFGGPDRRNNVRSIDQVRLNGQADCYASYQRATDALVTWVNAHTNGSGNPTVASFDGPTWAPFLPLDFDHQEDPAVALGWLRRVLLKLEAWDVNLRAARVYFSGGKGFHAELPHTLFGGFAPSADLHRRLKAAARLLLGDIPFDGSIYDKLRLWRLENSRHGKTGLYKVRLTAPEALTLDLATIRVLAERPRSADDEPELTPIPDDEWGPNEALADLWQQASAHPSTPRERRPGTVADDARDRQTVAAIAASWPRDRAPDVAPDAPRAAGSVSRHTDYLLPIAGFLAGRTSDDEHIAALLAQAAERAGDLDFLRARDWRAEIARLAKSSVDKRADGEPVTGLPTLGERFSALGAVLAALWPAPELGFGRDGGDRGAAATPDGDAVDPFPLDALPPSFRALVEQGAAAMVAPGDFVAVPLLVSAGAAIGSALELELKPGWREGANLYAAVVGDPGSKKSPTMGLGTRPILRVQRRLKAEYDAAIKEHERDLARWDAAPKAERGPKPKPPTFRHVFANDATTEALALMLQGAKGLLLFRDELTGWVRSMDQYRGGRGADRQHFLSMWSRSPIKVDRKGATPGVPPIFVERPCLSVVGGIQPELLPDLGDAAQRDDGFVDRLLWCYPDPVPDRWTPAGIDLEVVRAAEAALERLYRLQGAPRLGDDERSPRVVRLGGDAAERWAAWYDAHTAEMRSEGLPRRLRGPWAKLPGQLARLALILHALAEPVADELALETLEAAIRLLDYFKSHARRAYRQLGRQRKGRTLKVLAALKQWGPTPQHVLLRDVFQRNMSAGDLRATLEELEEAGLVTRSEDRDTGGRPAVLWAAA